MSQAHVEAQDVNISEISYYRCIDSVTGWPAVESRAVTSLSVTHECFEARLLVALIDRASTLYDPDITAMIFADSDGSFLTTQLLPRAWINNFDKCTNPIE